VHGLDDIFVSEFDSPVRPLSNVLGVGGVGGGSWGIAVSNVMLSCLDSNGAGGGGNFPAQ